MTIPFPLALARKLGINRNVVARPPWRLFARALAQRNALPLELLLGADLDVTFHATFPGATFLYHASPGDSLGARLYWQHWDKWEPYVVPVFAQYARHATRILDVGAHTGVYSLFGCALNLQVEVFSFEPLPQLYPRLVRNVSLNCYEGRCQLFPLAVSDAPGEARFHVAEDLTMSSLSDTGEITVQVITLDSLVPLDGRTALVKMDVEGHEYHALLGMNKIIEDSHPTILFECNPGSPGRQVGELLQTHGYRLFNLAEGDPQPLTELVPEHFPHGHHNFLALHPLRPTEPAVKR